MAGAKALNRSIDESGLIVQKKITKSDKQQTTFVKNLEVYQISSKELSKGYINHKTALNNQKSDLIHQYLRFAQRLDCIFTEMKDLGNDDMQDQIIATLVRAKEQTTDLNRTLLDVQTEILMTQAVIEQDKQVLVSGTKYTMQRAVEIEKRREVAYKEDKKNDKVMTL